MIKGSNGSNSSNGSKCMKAICFEDLKIWQEARELSKDVYAVSRLPEFSKDYRFVGQITSAVGSIMDNIAEGFERDGNKEFLQFLSIAKESCGEVRSQLYRAYDIGYIEKETFDTLLYKIKILSASIYHFMKNLKNSKEFKKFRDGRKKAQNRLNFRTFRTAACCA